MKGLPLQHLSYLIALHLIHYIRYAQSTSTTTSAQTTTNEVSSSTVTNVSSTTAASTSIGQTTPGLGWWGNWDEWQTCVGSCEWGVRSRFRMCPLGLCTGNSTESEQCDIQRYCEDGGWSIWGPYQPYSHCNRPCGTGHMTIVRNRQCLEPDDGCTGQTQNYSLYKCNTEPCFLHGNWADWREWTDTPCTTTCGFGTMTKTRLRTCSDPQPTLGGKNCEGESSQFYRIPCKNEVDCDDSTELTTSVTYPNVVDPSTGIMVTMLGVLPAGVLIYCAVMAAYRTYGRKPAKGKRYKRSNNNDIYDEDDDWYKRGGIGTISATIDMPNDRPKKPERPASVSAIRPVSVSAIRTTEL